MIYELRIYAVSPGRLADVHARFAEHLPELFGRHGVNCVGRWSALVGPDAPRFVYLLAYRDYAHREAVWTSFYQDSEWWRIRVATNAGHEMVERHDLLFLKPNAAWEHEEEPAGDTVGGLHEMLQQQVAPGQNAAANVFLKEYWLPSLRQAGGRLLGIFDVASGAGMPKIVILHAWTDAAAWHVGRRQLEEDETLRTELSSQRQRFGTTVFERAEVSLLEPALGGAVRSGLGRSPA